MKIPIIKKIYIIFVKYEALIYLGIIHKYLEIFESISMI